MLLTAVSNSRSWSRTFASVALTTGSATRRLLGQVRPLRASRRSHLEDRTWLSPPPFPGSLGLCGLPIRPVKGRNSLRDRMTHLAVGKMENLPICAVAGCQVQPTRTTRGDELASVPDAHLTCRCAATKNGSGVISEHRDATLLRQAVEFLYNSGRINVPIRSRPGR